MSEPRIELITKDIETAINAITTANGFNQGLSAVRPKRINFLEQTWDDGTVLIVQGANEPLQKGFVNRWRQNYSLMAIVRKSDSETASIDSFENQVRSDIEKKLMTDIRRSGYAENTECLGAVPFVTNDGINSGINIDIAVDYRTKENDPYTAA
jgi:hypothetical protein